MKGRRIKICAEVALSIGTLLTLSLCWSQLAFAKTGSSSVTKADLDADGNLHIIDSRSREFVAPKKDDQADCRSPKIAEDKRTVGWLAEYPNPGTSYPIPLSLLIYRDGKIIREIRPNNALAIWDWRFLKSGTEVAFWSGRTHGNFVPHFELRDVRSGRLLAEWDGHVYEPHPAWVSGLKE